MARPWIAPCARSTRGGSGGEEPGQDPSIAAPASRSAPPMASRRPLVGPSGRSCDARPRPRPASSRTDADGHVRLPKGPGPPELDHCRAVAASAGLGFPGTGRRARGPGRHRSGRGCRKLVPEWHAGRVRPPLFPWLVRSQRSSRKDEGPRTMKAGKPGLKSIAPSGNAFDAMFYVGYLSERALKRRAGRRVATARELVKDALRDHEPPGALAGDHGVASAVPALAEGQFGDGCRRDRRKRAQPLAPSVLQLLAVPRRRLRDADESRRPAGATPVRRMTKENPCTS